MVPMRVLILLAALPLVAAVDTSPETYEAVIVHPGSGSDIVTLFDGDEITVRVTLPADRADAREYTLNLFVEAGSGGVLRLVSLDGYPLAEATVPIGGGWVSLASPWADVWWGQRDDATLIVAGDVTVHTQSSIPQRVPHMVAVRAGDGVAGCN